MVGTFYRASSPGAKPFVEVGSQVTRFAVGDRVVGIFMPGWLDGDHTFEAFESSRGGNAGGMLSEIIVSNQDALVRIPNHLSYEEAATLPCAALTAWVGLFKRGNIQAGQYVLLEGTGGVSVFGLLFASAVGARPILVRSGKGRKTEATLPDQFADVPVYDDLAAAARALIDEAA